MSGRRVGRWLCLGMAAAALFGCGSVPPSPEHELRIKGSDTMLILNRRLAEGFMRSHPGVSVIVEGGGTSTGVEALIRSEVSICAASRPLAPAEVQRLFDAFGTLGVRMPIARDALSVWVHPDNPVSSLSLDELGRIYAGSVGVWSDLGGDDGEITVVVRPPASGTFRFFRDRVLAGGRYSSRTVTAAVTRDVVERVAADPDAIGYGGAAYGTVGVRACAIDGALPTAETDGEGGYPLTRHLVFYTAAPPEGLSREFVDWAQGSEGQAVVAEIGYLPLWRRQ
jgi:phosphate transport system substrate-binding protein